MPTIAPVSAVPQFFTALATNAYTLRANVPASISIAHIYTKIPLYIYSSFLAQTMGYKGHSM